MLISHVVVDASPLICLFKSGLENLLPALFGDIVVPETVNEEVISRPKTGPSLALTACRWIHLVNDITIDSRVAAWDLGRGESSVLSFALKNPGYWAIIDDKEARRCAVSLQCHHTGTVGIIVLAKKRGIIRSIRENLEKLRMAGLWLSENFIDEVCVKAAKEWPVF